MTKRASGLDVLRGIAILGMFLSGLLPFYKNTLPNWMYHAQMPPPLHKFSHDVIGITWVDLVFPFFIFAMGAAIPFALSRQLEKHESYTKIIRDIIVRFLLLAGFAIYIQHIKPYSISSEPNLHVWIVSLIGFATLFPALLKLPANFSNHKRFIIRSTGLATITGLLFYIFLVFDKPISPEKSDIIILVLSNVYLFGAILWVFTRNNYLARFSVLLILLALRLSHSETGLANIIWDISPLPWLFKVYYLQYLFILIPGTLAGDILHKFASSNEDSGSVRKPPYIFYATLALLTIPVSLYGLFSREIPGVLIVLFITIMIMYLLLMKIEGAPGILLRGLFSPAVIFIITGFLLEPYEGGIRKDHATLSFYFISSGLAFFALSALTIIADVLKQNGLKLFESNGQNPLLAYAGISNLLPPLLAISGLGTLLNYMVINPWLGFLKGLFVTLLLAIIVFYFTKKKLILRA